MGAQSTARRRCAGVLWGMVGAAVTFLSLTTGLDGRAAGESRPERRPAALTAGCAPLDIVLVIDSSTSMGPAIVNVKSQTASLIERIVTESGGDYRIGMVDFADDVQVRVPMQPGNAEGARAAIPGMFQDRNNFADPEAWDEALTTVIDGRTAAAANAAAAAGGANGMQIGDFNADWRAEAKKIVLLVTDATAGGFAGSTSQEAFDRAYSAAVRAKEKDIRVATVFVPNSNSQPEAADQLAAVSNQSGAPALRSASDGSNLTDGLNLTVSTCAADSDGDGLFDTWETNGYDANGDGAIDVDLKSMGADPRHKDLFVQVNWMQPDEVRPCWLGIYCPAGPPGPQPPNPMALAQMAKMFAAAPVENPDGKTGISVHFDAGGLEPPGTAIGGNVHAGGASHLDTSLNLAGSQADRDLARKMYDTTVPTGRHPLFTWVLYGRTCGGPKCVGYSPGTPGDTSVLASPKFRGDTNLEAVTLVHEIGHTLGLRHGGVDDAQPKPNYLSIMNYGFAFSGGLATSERRNILDYSQFDLAPLDPSHLDESSGVTSKPGTPTPAGYLTGHRCPNDPRSVVGFRLHDLAPIDWNCDGDTSDSDVSSPNLVVGIGEVPLEDRDDWATITFAGGNRGGLENQGEPSDDEDFTREAWDASLHQFGVDITGPAAVQSETGTHTVRLPFRVRNTGTETVAYTAKATVTNDWPVSVPTKNLDLSAGEVVTVNLDISIPAVATTGEQALATLELTSDDPSNLGGAATAAVHVGNSTDVSSTGALQVTPNPARPTKTVTIEGAGFAPLADVLVSSPISTIGTRSVTSDPTGRIRLSVHAPGAAEVGPITAIGPSETSVDSGTPPTSRSSTLDPPTSTTDEPTAADVQVLTGKLVVKRPAPPTEPTPVALFVAAGIAVFIVLTAIVLATRRRQRTGPPAT